VKATGLKDIGVWGTMLEGRVFPVGKARKALKTGTASRKAAARGDSQDWMRKASRDHHHADGDCCACTMNRALARAVSWANR